MGASSQRKVITILFSTSFFCEKLLSGLHVRRTLQTTTRVVQKCNFISHQFHTTCPVFPSSPLHLHMLTMHLKATCVSITHSHPHHRVCWYSGIRYSEASMEFLPTPSSTQPIWRKNFKIGCDPFLSHFSHSIIRNHFIGSYSTLFTLNSTYCFVN